MQSGNAALCAVEHRICLSHLCLALRQPELQALAQPLADLLGRIRQFPTQRPAAFVVHHDRMRFGDCRHARRQLTIHHSGASARQRHGNTRQQRLRLRQCRVPCGRLADTDARRPLWPHVRIAEVPPRHGTGKQRAVSDAARHHPHSIKALRHELHAEAVDRAVARLVAHDAAICRRPDHAACGLRAVGQRKETSPPRPPQTRCWNRPAYASDCAGLPSDQACVWRTRW